ncbi:hypothetical protein HPB50_002824 [Hyalomma asiaticum]|uniref:Uncharacterized protein n=1 Tax=Hyalomma asiaticum TaxID=266040 RepID=A0ACB7SRR2_HYAAI|nr:hypothetical protein HPB50_002824 [Hyalomma asiaticum]
MEANTDATVTAVPKSEDAASLKEDACHTEPQSHDDGTPQPPKIESGMARIKTEFIKQSQLRHVETAFVAPSDRTSVATDGEVQPPPRKKLRGQNHSRPHHRPQPQSAKLCFRHLAKEGSCLHGEQCRYSHDVQAFLAAKPADLGNKCPLVEAHGGCRYGVVCRFAEAHPGGATAAPHSVDGISGTPGECNALSKEVQQALRKRQFDFGPSEKILKEISTGAAANGVANGQALDNCVADVGLEEPKRVDFRGKLYLAPLTTLCGAHPDVMTRCAQLLRDKCSVDFVDINMGCPIDFVYKKGAGSGLMGRAKKLAEIVYGMVGTLDMPLTVKMRAGMHEGRPIAHQVIAQLVEAPRKPALITVHPRSREQRYTKSADWAYLDRCAQAANPIPVFGSGDILSWEDAEKRLSETSVSGLMIARGALIKPWIFTEIKERRHWDISSSERLDILRKYTAYGLDHWGSDTEGVERTRRFLLEWLSFLHRYIPVGLLEVLPQKINERPPPYRGRDDLETLFASPSCADWLKISEMLLGPLPEGFSFLPKHKANAYSV